jgi:hypothetical protein
MFTTTRLTIIFTHVDQLSCGRPSIEKRQNKNKNACLRSGLNFCQHVMAQISTRCVDDAQGRAVAEMAW